MRTGGMVAIAVAAALSLAPPTAAQEGGESCLTAEPPQPGTIEPLRFGITPGMAGSAGATQEEPAAEDPRKTVAALRALRARGGPLVLRLNRLFWADGKKGIRRFERLVRRYGRAGLRSEIQVRYHPPEGREGDIDGFERFVRTAVRRLGRKRSVVGFSITNEANLPISPNTSDGAYEGVVDALVRGVIAARAELVRLGRPRLDVGFNVMWRWSPEGDRKFWESIGAHPDVRRFRRSVSNVGLQIYPGLVWPPAPLPTSTAGEEVAEALTLVRDCYMPKAGLGRAVELWVSENGYATNLGRSEESQLRDLESTIDAVVRMSGALGVTDYRWFNLRDNNSDGADIFSAVGLLRDDYSPKPAFAALRAAIRRHGAGRRAGAARERRPTPPGPEFQGDPAEYASAFAAKEICSRALIAKRDPAPIVNDLRGASALAPGFFIDSAEIEIDRRRGQVAVAHPGQPPRTARRARDQGCVIVPSYSGRLHFRPRRIPWRGPPASRRWPVGERLWQGASDIDRGALDAALDAYIKREGTRALVVVHKGELVGERYAPGFGPFVQQRSWSTAKSITATLVGLLVDRRRMRLDRPPPLLREWAGDARRQITLRQLLNMSSGLKQNQYEGSERSLETFTPSSEHAFVYFDGFDTYADALEAPLEVPPGSRWQYRNANVLSAAASAKRVLARSGRDLSVWAQRRLLEPLGMRTTTLETDPYGQFIASGTAFTTARDLARLGLVHLRDGRWAGRRFLSRRWTRFVRRPGPQSPHYGGFWWINHGREAFPSLPEDTYYASGAFGQNALVIPAHDLVIARMGWNVPNDDAALDAFAALVVSAAGG